MAKPIAIFTAALLACLLTGAGLIQPQDATLQVIDQSWNIQNNDVWEATVKFADAENTAPTIELAIFGNSAGRPSSDTIIHVVKPQATLGQDGTINIALSIKDLGSDSDAIAIPEPGAYPIEIRAKRLAGTSDESIVASTKTTMIVSNEADANRSIVALLDSKALTNALDFGQLPSSLIVALDGQSVAALAQDSELLSSARATFGDRQVVVFHANSSALSKIDPLIVSKTYFEPLGAWSTWLASQGFNVNTQTAYMENLTSSDAALLANNSYRNVVTRSTFTGWSQLTPSSERTIAVAASGPAPQPDTNLAGIVQQAYSPGGSVIVLNVANNQDIATLNKFAASEKALSLQPLAAPIGPNLPAMPIADSIDASLSITQAQLLSEAEQKLSSYSAFEQGSPAKPIEYEARLVSAIGQDDGARLLTELSAEVQTDFDLITISQGQSLNLSSTQARVPVTINNDTGSDKRVRLSLLSDMIDVSPTNQIVTLTPGTNLIEVEVNLRSFGKSVLDITVATPDGGQVLADSDLSLRSNSFPGLGLGLSGLALASLAVWWYLSNLKSRQALQQISVDDADLRTNNQAQIAEPSLPATQDINL